VIDRKAAKSNTQLAPTRVMRTEVPIALFSTIAPAGGVTMAMRPPSYKRRQPVPSSSEEKTHWGALKCSISKSYVLEERLRADGGCIQQRITCAI